MWSLIGQMGSPPIMLTTEHIGLKKTKNNERPLLVHWSRGIMIFVWTQNGKLVNRKGCNVRWDAVVDRVDVVSYLLQSLLDAIELTILCAFVCILG